METYHEEAVTRFTHTRRSSFSRAGLRRREPPMRLRVQTPHNVDHNLPEADHEHLGAAFEQLDKFHKHIVYHCVVQHEHVVVAYNHDHDRWVVYNGAGDSALFNNDNARRDHPLYDATAANYYCAQCDDHYDSRDDHHNDRPVNLDARYVRPPG